MGENKWKELSIDELYELIHAPDFNSRNRIERQAIKDAFHDLEAEGAELAADAEAEAEEELAEDLADAAAEETTEVVESSEDAPVETGDEVAGEEVVDNNEAPPMGYNS